MIIINDNDNDKTMVQHFRVYASSAKILGQLCLCSITVFLCANRFPHKGQEYLCGSRWAYILCSLKVFAVLNIFLHKSHLNNDALSLWPQTFKCSDSLPKFFPHTGHCSFSRCTVLMCRRRCCFNMNLLPQIEHTNLQTSVLCAVCL